MYIYIIKGSKLKVFLIFNVYTKNLVTTQYKLITVKVYR